MVYYFICSIGLCWILKYGSILNRIRNFLSKQFTFFSDLFKCSLCLGFWCGVILAPIFCIEYGLIKSILYPFASSAVCWSADIIIDFISGLNLVYVEKNLESSSDHLEKDPHHLID